MKDLFKHASSSWVKYDRYEWKKGTDEAMKEYQSILTINTQTV